MRSVRGPFGDGLRDLGVFLVCGVASLVLVLLPMRLWPGAFWDVNQMVADHQRYAVNLTSYDVPANPYRVLLWQHPKDYQEALSHKLAEDQTFLALEPARQWALWQVIGGQSRGLAMDVEPWMSPILERLTRVR